MCKLAMSGCIWLHGMMIEAVVMAFVAKVKKTDSIGTEEPDCVTIMKLLMVRMH